MMASDDNKVGNNNNEQKKRGVVLLWLVGSYNSQNSNIYVYTPFSK